MSTIVMPVAYCKIKFGTLREVLLDDDIADESEIGSERIRARTTKIRTSVKYDLELTTTADIAAFDAFIKDDLKIRRMPFVWTNSITGGVLTMRLDNAPTKTTLTNFAARYNMAMTEI